MNSVNYTLFVQRITAICLALSLFAISALLVFTSPLESWYIYYIILFLAWCFLSSLILLIQFWWFFSFKKELLNIPHVNIIILDSSIIALSLVFLYVLNFTENLDWISFFTWLLGLSLYRFWLASFK